MSPDLDLGRKLVRHRCSVFASGSSHLDLDALASFLPFHVTEATTIRRGRQDRRSPKRRHHSRPCGMPYSHVIYPEMRLALVTLVGEVDGAQIIEAARATIEHPNWEPGFFTLWDAREVRQLLLDVSEINEISEFSYHHADRFGAGKAALVVARDLDHTMGRMFSRTNRNPDRVLEVFWKADQAVEWLELTEWPDALPRSRGLDD